jgi:hypothetical protein
MRGGEANRRWRHFRRDIAPVRLTQKYAEKLDGVDLSDADVGDRLPLSPREAELLVAEGWAEPLRGRSSDWVTARDAGSAE